VIVVRSGTGLGTSLEAKLWGVPDDVTVIVALRIRSWTVGLMM